MARLCASDYRDVLEVVYAAGELDETPAFAEPVLEALRRLVHCDVVTFHERSESAQRVLVYAGEPAGS